MREELLQPKWNGGCWYLLCQTTASLRILAIYLNQMEKLHPMQPLDFYLVRVVRGVSVGDISAPFDEMLRRDVWELQLFWGDVKIMGTSRMSESDIPARMFLVTAFPVFDNDFCLGYSNKWEMSKMSADCKTKWNLDELTIIVTEMDRAHTNIHVGSPGPWCKPHLPTLTYACRSRYAQSKHQILPNIKRRRLIARFFWSKSPGFDTQWYC